MPSSAATMKDLCSITFKQMGWFCTVWILCIIPYCNGNGCDGHVGGISEPVVPDFVRLLTVGGRLELICNNTNSDGETFKMNWDKGSESLYSSGNRDVYPSGKLVYDPTEESDVGNYTCTSRTGTPYSETFRVIKHELQPLPTNIELKAGDDLKLECQASGSSTPSFNWTKGQHSVQEPITTSARFNITPASVLNLYNVSVKDNGLYTCHAASPEGVIFSSSTCLYVPEKHDESLGYGAKILIALLCISLVLLAIDIACYFIKDVGLTATIVHLMCGKEKKKKAAADSEPSYETEGNEFTEDNCKVVFSGTNDAVKQPQQPMETTAIMEKTI